MKMRIAIFRSTSMGYVTPVEQRKDWTTGELDDNYSPTSDYVRLTEWQEVDLPELPPDQVIPQQLAALAREREEAVEKFHKALADIDGRIANLRAVTHQPEPQL
jgi:hypothetical protein